MKHLIPLLLLLATLALGLSGCQTLQQIATPAQARQQVEQAADARLSLWDALQAERDLFTEAEWKRAEYVHQKAVALGADLNVGLEPETLPPVAEVEAWRLQGEFLFADAEALLEPKLSDLSNQVQMAWALEKARLRALQRTAGRYIDNPNQQTQAELVRIGLQVGGALLGSAL